MSELTPKTKELFDRLRALELPKGSYVVFGSGPLAIRGLKEPHDLDVVVTEDVYNEYKVKEGWKELVRNDDTCMVKDGIELWYSWTPDTWDVGVLIQQAEEIDGLPFVPLPQVLIWKVSSGRSEDLEDVERIRAHLAQQQG